MERLSNDFEKLIGNFRGRRSMQDEIIQRCSLFGGAKNRMIRLQGAGFI